MGGVEDFSYWTLADIDHPLPVEGDDDDEVIPNQYALYQNFPNPFNPETIIKFDLPESDIVKLNIFNTLGEEVAQIVNEQLQAGTYYYNFNAENLPSGVYIYKLITSNYQSSNKMLLLK